MWRYRWAVRETQSIEVRRVLYVKETPDIVERYSWCEDDTAAIVRTIASHGAVLLLPVTIKSKTGRRASRVVRGGPPCRPPPTVGGGRTSGVFRRQAAEVRPSG